MVAVLEMKGSNHTIFSLLIFLVTDIWVFHEFAYLCESTKVHIEPMQVLIDRNFKEVRVMLVGKG